MGDRRRPIAGAWWASFLMAGAVSVALVVAFDAPVEAEEASSSSAAATADGGAAPTEAAAAEAPPSPTEATTAGEGANPASGAMSEQPLAARDGSDQLEGQAVTAPSEGEGSAGPQGRSDASDASGESDDLPPESATAETTSGEGGDEATTSSEEETSRFPATHFGHRLQGGVSVLAGSGYQFEIAYGGDKCRTADGSAESVCHHRAPVFLDLLLSFGATEGLEVLAELRIGMLEDTNFNELEQEITSRPMAVGIGLRYLVTPLSRFKFFIGAMLDVDFTSGLKTDVYLRPIFGVQVEFVRWVGLFVQGSVNLSFIRYFGISLDGYGGLQFRFP